MYSNKIIEIFQNVKNVGIIKGASGTGVAGNACCGDIIKIFIKVEDEKIVDAKFKTFGCIPSIVASEIATDMLKNKTIDEAKGITKQNILDEIGILLPEKIDCVSLAIKAISETVSDYYKKQEKLARKK